jgi:hypothetical protein
MSIERREVLGWSSRAAHGWAGGRRGTAAVTRRCDVVGTRPGGDDAEARREGEEPDYARGQDHEEHDSDRPDFARGQREGVMDPHEGSFAEGQEEGPEHHPEPTDHGDFARGQRGVDPDRP